MPMTTSLKPSLVRNVMKNVIRDSIFFVLLPTVYRLAARRPASEQHALFVEETKENVPDSFRLVIDELKKRGITCEFISLGHYQVSTLDYYLRCIDMVRRVARTSLVFLNDASAPISCLPMRRQTKVIQLWHACGAFKKFGMSTADKTFGDSRSDKLRHPYYENLSLVTVSSPEVVWAYEEAMALEDRGIVRPLGVSRTDVFYDKKASEAAKVQIEKAFSPAKGKKILLYAPTFRGQLDDAHAPDALDLNYLKEHIGNGWVVLVKHHPFVKKRPPIPAGCEAFAFDVSDLLPIESCLCGADACITDYSSVVFEYSLLRRPIAFFAFDKADYEDWRGFYYDYDEMTPGPVLYTSAEVARWVASLNDGFDTSEVDAFRDRFMSSCDGVATKRIVDEALALEGNTI